MTVASFWNSPEKRIVFFEMRDPLVFTTFKLVSNSFLQTGSYARQEKKTVASGQHNNNKNKWPPPTPNSNDSKMIYCEN